MSGLFIAQESRPDGLLDLDVDALTPFQRALLVIDGTVTQFIEAYTAERVDVTCLSQKRRVLTQPHTWLEVESGASVIARDVLLKGAKTGEVYAYGTSLIAPERLEGPLLAGVEGAEESLGRLLRQNRAETYRELLWRGLEPADAPPCPGMQNKRQPHICRCYRMICRNHPLMVIVERFPLNLHV
ncbi:MAG: chorismate pyruvate-lyase family protein [Candidatus Poribacteria bacterium]|nr:chorismate pyruvate-lyase family protein [Candidatus Poribacteria bacterium]